MQNIFFFFFFLEKCQTKKKRELFPVWYFIFLLAWQRFILTPSPWLECSFFFSLKIFSQHLNC